MGREGFQRGDFRNVARKDLPDVADLVWASFPCQNLSLAGGGGRLNGERSRTFWPIWSLVTALGNESRAPRMIALENVWGTLTSRNGSDFTAICSALHDGGYRIGAFVINAVLFVPQSRPRLLIVAARNGVSVPGAICGDEPTGAFCPLALRKAFDNMPADLRATWIWWRLPSPPARNTDFSDLIEENPEDVAWHTSAETPKLLSMMDDTNLKKVRTAKQEGRRIVGTVYKRTWRDAAGRRVQCAEVRFDGVAGCLRTPAGGSSRQLDVSMEGGKVRSRLISSRETARLMGLPDEYELPGNYNEAYHLTGDGVVAPGVRFLAESVIEPVLLHARKMRRAT